MLPISQVDGQQSSASAAVAFGGAWWFQADDGVHGYQLFGSDGTPSGTGIADPVQAALGGGSGFPTLALGGQLLLRVQSPAGDSQLWSTDGTTAGTRQLTAVPGTSGLIPDEFVALGSIGVFTGNAPQGQQVWRTDGTPEGTAPVTDFGGLPSAQPNQLVRMGNAVYFAATDAVHGRELWRTDGTAAGTQRLTDLPNGDPGPARLVASRHRVYFASGADWAPGHTLWMTDGTAAGTRAIESGPSVTDDVSEVVGVDAGAFYVFGDGDQYGDLRRVDEQGRVTHLRTFRANEPFGAPRDLTAMNDQDVVFAATGGDDISRLWCSNGTAAGTVPVVPASIGDPAALNTPYDFTVVGGDVYFAAYDAAHGNELWRTDGSADGTALAADLEPGTGSSWPKWLSAPGGRLWFIASSGTWDEQPWLLAPADPTGTPHCAVAAAPPPTPTPVPVPTPHATVTPTPVPTAAVPTPAPPVRLSRPSKLTLTHGQLHVVQRLPGAGAVRWRLLLGSGRRPAVLSDRRRTVARAGSRRLDVRLSRHARRLLGQRRHARLLLRTAFTPAGARTAVVRTVRIRRS